MKKMKKVIALLAVLTMSVGVLAACGNSGGSTPTTEAKTETKGDIKEEITVTATNKDPLKFIWFSDGGEGDVMQSIIDDFTAETGIALELITVPYNDHEAKISIMLQGGEVPALARITNAGYFADYALQLNDVVSTEDYLESSKMAMVDLDGNVIAIPVDVTANGIVLNKTLMDKYEIKYPKLGEEVWTWNEFMAEMSKLIGKEDVVYPGVYDFSAHRFATVLYTYDASILNVEGTEVTVNSPEAVQAMDMFVNLHEQKILDPSVWAGNGDPNTLFRSGKYGFHFAGNWMLDPYKDLEFEIAIAPVPVGTSRATVPGGKYIMGYEGSGYEEEAKQFLEYFAQAEVHDRFNRENLFLSARKTAKIEYSAMNDHLNMFQDDISNAPLVAGTDWASPHRGVFSNELKIAAAEAVAGVKTSQEALDYVAELIQAELE